MGAPWLRSRLTGSARLARAIVDADANPGADLRLAVYARGQDLELPGGIEHRTAEAGTTRRFAQDLAVLDAVVVLRLAGDHAPTLTRPAGIEIAAQLCI